MSAKHFPISYRTDVEHEIIESMRAGSASLLALLESWPDNGKLATVTGAANTLKALRRLLVELQALLANDMDLVA